MAPKGKAVLKQPAKACFRQDSKEFKFLVTLFKKGQIKPDEKPGNVRSKHSSVFSKYSPAQFRAQFSKARTLSGMQVATPADEDDDEEPDTEGDVGSVVPASENVDTASEVNDNDGPTAWVPKKIVCEYTNKDNIPCMAMLFPLTGGACISQQSDVEVKLVDNGWTIIVIERWTYHYADMKDYYSRHPRERDLSDEDWVRRSLAMNDEIERMKLAALHGLVSVYRHRLPWKAAEIVDQITGTTDGARTCHIDVYSKRRIQEKKIFIADSKKTKGNKAHGIFQNSPSANYSLVNE